MNPQCGVIESYNATPIELNRKQRWKVALMGAAKMLAF